MTHTYAELEVSAEAYDEIAQKLREAGYHHAFIAAKMEIGGVQAEAEPHIDMHGIGLVRATGVRPPVEPRTLEHAITLAAANPYNLTWHGGDVERLRDELEQLRGIAEDEGAGKTRG